MIKRKQEEEKESMRRRQFIQAMGIGTASWISGSCRRRDTKGLNGKRFPPNFVIILTDDLGYGDLGCYGARGYETPNLDRMAAEGMRFSSFYVSQAVCSASRASLLTGCYSNRVGIFGAYFPDSKAGLNAAEETIAEVLKKKAYAAGIFGKWHLGHHLEFLPLQHGFDEYLGLPYSNDMWPVDFNGTPLKKEHWKSALPYPPLIDGNEKVAEIRTLEDQASLTTRYTERAVKFIKSHKERPFFLYLSHSMPHVPLGVSSKFSGKSNQGMYGDVVMEIDWSVGEILKTLHDNGLAENTLVIFASDNGPWLNYGNHAGSAGPLREGKGTSWEGGVRVPCLMRWPGKIPDGSVCDKIASTLDLLPTLAEIAGAPLPAQTIDGFNLQALLLGDTQADPRDHFYFYYGEQLQAVRQGQWKLHFPHKYPSCQGMDAGGDGWPGPSAVRETGLELYDLKNDISERNNAVDDHPEMVKQLQALGEKAREELGDSGRKGSGVRPPGYTQQ